MGNLSTTWIESRLYDIESEEYEKRSWAVDQLYSLACTDAEKLLHVVTDILKEEASEAVVAAIGAGVIEDLLVKHGDTIIDSVVVLALQDKSFMRCVRYTFIDENDVSAEVCCKFNRLKEHVNP